MPVSSHPSTPPPDPAPADTGTLVDQGVEPEQPTPVDTPPAEPDPTPGPADTPA